MQLHVLLIATLMSLAQCQYHEIHQHFHSSNHHNHPFGFISNMTLSGSDAGCKFATTYETTAVAKFQMCIGQQPIDLKNGMTIINLVQSRGYLPTCRVLHLLLWMKAESSVNQNRRGLQRDVFIDIGANIGSCSVHMASLGFPVISIEPVQQHVDTIQGSKEINPSFHIEIHKVGMASTDKIINASFGHGARNWGATSFVEIQGEEQYETKIELRTLDRILGNRKASLAKIDCEGCEFEALAGGKRSLHRIPMFKIELVQSSYSHGNESITPEGVVNFLHDNGYDVYKDHWLENNLYFGRRGNDILEIDKLFGSTKFKLGADVPFLEESAKKILSDPIVAADFNSHNFRKSYTDIIAIQRSLSIRMKQRFLGTAVPAA